MVAGTNELAKRVSDRHISSALGGGGICIHNRVDSLRHPTILYGGRKGLPISVVQLS